MTTGRPAPTSSRPPLARRAEPGSRPRRSGFTLLELVVVMALLVLVLMMCYQILNNCLTTERDVARYTVPEKVGEGILSLMRRDIAGVFYRGFTEQLQNEVFMGREGESPEGPRDEVRFLTTVPPTTLQETEYYEERIEDLRTVTLVGYFLEENGDIAGPHRAYRLYRKEVTDFDLGNPMNAPGLNLEIYDKVKSLDIQYYDGFEWLVEWDSRRQIELEAAALLEEANQLASGRSRTATVTGGAGEGALDTTAPLQSTVLPPAAIPTAVRIELEVYSGTGSKIEEIAGEPVIRRFRTIVPILAARRIAIQLDDPALTGGEMGGEMGEDGGLRGAPSDGLRQEGDRSGGRRGGRGDRAPARGRLPPGLPGGAGTGERSGARGR